MAAYRLPYLLAGDSVVLKQDSSYYEHFYNELQPWEHYIPIRADLGDLLEKIQWAREHDEEVKMRMIADIRFGSKCRDVVVMCSGFFVVIYNHFVQSTFSHVSVAVVMFLAVFQVKKIALAGQQFARNHLMGDKIFCYYYKLFQVTFLQLQLRQYQKYKPYYEKV